MIIYYVYYCFLFVANALAGRKCYYDEWDEQYIALLSSSGRLKKSEKRFLILAFGALVLLLGLRNQEMGVDLAGYLPAFDSISTFSWQEAFSRSVLNYEHGYILFNKCVSVIINNRQFLLFACAVFSLIPIGNIIFRYSNDTLFSVVIYLGLPCFLMSFSGLRQAIAIAITFYSFRFVQERRLIPFLITIAIASQFHYTAFIAAIIYPLYRIKLSKQWAYASLLLIPIVYILRLPLFIFASRILKENARIDNNGAFTLFAVFSLIYIFCLIFGDREDEKVNGLSNIVLVACLVQAMGSLHQEVMRAGFYYMIYMVLLLPAVTSCSNKISSSQMSWIKRVVFLCFLAFGIYSIRNSTWPEANPYYFFWETYR